MSYAQHPLNTVAMASSSYDQMSPAQYHDHSQGSMPKVGGTRCYWTLLTYPALTFAYLDPVLQHHLEDDSPQLVGRSLLDFVHPEDQEHVRRDLGSVLETKNLYGSETRVRFSRLSRVRKVLSSSSSDSRSSPQYPYASQPWASAISIDDNYMSVNLIISCPARSVILCFIHAAVDLDVGADNDLSTAVTMDGQRRRGWTNWCGTGLLGPKELQAIWGALNNIDRTHQQPPEPDRVSLKFQILSNTPQHEIMISWPPDPGPLPDHNLGGLMAQDFAKLVTNVIMDEESTSNAKTSCTKRHRGRRSLITASRTQVDVESIYIPYGTIIFACHKVVSVSSLPPSQDPSSHTSMSRHSPLMLAYPHAPPSHLPIDNGGPNSGQHHQTLLPPLSSSGTSPYSAPYSYAPSQATSTANGSNRWTEYSVQNGSNSSSNTSASSTAQPIWNHDRASHYSSSWTNNGQNANGIGIGQGYGRVSPDNGYASYSSQAGGAGPLSDSGDHTGQVDDPNNVVPPPKKRLSPNSVPRGDGTFNGTIESTTSSAKTRHGVRPPGLMRCSSCKATTSPEWRKGPSGKKELCNACGLRFARSKAKKEGNVGRKKKADKNAKASRDSGSPSSVTSTFHTVPHHDYVPHVPHTPPPPPQQQQSSYQHNVSPSHQPMVPNGNYLQYNSSQGQYAPPSPHQTAYYNAATSLASLNQYSYDRSSYSVADRAAGAAGYGGRVSSPLAYDRESREREQERHRQRDREARVRDLEGSASDSEYRHRDVSSGSHIGFVSE